MYMRLRVTFWLLSFVLESFYGISTGFSVALQVAAPRIAAQKVAGLDTTDKNERRDSTDYVSEECFHARLKIAGSHANRPWHRSLCGFN